MIDILIEADNVPQTCARPDSTLEKLFKVHSHAKSIADDEGNVDWEKAEVMACRSTLEHQHEITDIVKWVKSSAGGLEDPITLKEADSYSKTLSKVRDIPSCILGRFDGLDLGVTGSPLWRAACLKIQLSSERATDHNVSKYFNPIGISNMGKTLRPAVLAANDVMEKARAILKTVAITEGKVPASKLAEVSGRLDVRLVAHVMKRPVLGSFSTLSEIGCTWYAEMNELLKNSDLSMPSSPWGKQRWVATTSRRPRV